MSKKSISVLAAVIAIVVLIAGGLGIYTLVSDSRDDEQILNVNTSELNIKVFVNEEDLVSEYQTNAFEGQSAFDMLKALDEQSEDFSFNYTEYDFGPFVTTMNTLFPNENEFIEFIVNGEQAAVGISDYKLKNNDEITFKKTKIESFSL